MRNPVHSRATPVAVRSLAIAMAFVPAPLAIAQIGQGVPLPGKSIPKFVDPLPSVHITDETEITLSMEEVRAPVMPSTFRAANGTYHGTWVWRYKDVAGHAATTYIGPIVLATRDVPTQMRFRNDLPCLRTRASAT